MDLFSLSVNPNFTFNLFFSLPFILIISCLILFYLILKNKDIVSGSNVEISETRLGIGSNTITLKPNYVDLQIAYKLWVELSTRKIGLKIDLEDDVINEIYNSWYEFFGITRELIKNIPITKIKSPDTKKIIELSIDILNKGIRPHLTKWQARFRKWYDEEKGKGSTPQEIQRKFKDYDKLTKDLIELNNNLIEYRSSLRKIIDSFN